MRCAILSLWMWLAETERRQLYSPDGVSSSGPHLRPEGRGRAEDGQSRQPASLSVVV